MVTVGQPRKSVRPAMSAGASLAGTAYGFGDNLGRKSVRQGVLGRHHLEVDTTVLEAAEHRRDPPPGVARRRGRTGDLDDDHLAGRWRPRSRRAAPGSRGGSADRRARRVLRSGRRPRTARRSPLGPLEHTDDAPLEPLGSAALDTHDHAVTVHRLREIGRRDEDTSPASRLRSSGATKP